MLAINETRLNGSISDQDVKVEGYDVIRCDRTVNGRFGGGVCFYIHLDINYVVREDLGDQLLEILSIENRKPNSKPCVVTSWYRPPNSSPDLFPHLDTVLGRLDSEHVAVARPLGIESLIPNNNAIFSSIFSLFWGKMLTKMFGKLLTFT